MKREKFKPCPRCGSLDVGINNFVNFLGIPCYYVECAECGIRTQAEFTERIATKNWNWQPNCEFCDIDYRRKTESASVYGKAVRKNA